MHMGFNIADCAAYLDHGHVRIPGPYLDTTLDFGEQHRIINPKASTPAQGWTNTATGKKLTSRAKDHKLQSWAEVKQSPDLERNVKLNRR